MTDKRTVGLPITFLFVFYSEHLFGALVNALPWFVKSTLPDVITGFRYSTYAVVAFSFGSLFLAPLIDRTFNLQRVKSKTFLPDHKLPKIYLTVGFIFYFIIAPFIKNIPSIRTLIYSSWNLITVAVCIGAWSAWISNNKRLFFQWVLLGSIAPLFTMLTGGFIGFGAMAFLVIVCFVAVFYKPKYHIVIGGAVAFYLGISLFVNYMEHRVELREKVWGGKPMDTRIEVTLKMIRNFKIFDFKNEKHLEAIDNRLNQNLLVGTAVRYIDSGNAVYAYGDTIKNAFIAVIPRIIWRSKPFVLGGSALVTEYTGLKFDKHTTVGIGFVMESYVNFGVGGILCFFCFFGTLLSLIDRACAHRLAEGNWRSFIYYFLPCATIMWSTSFLVLAMGTASSLIYCNILDKFVIPMIVGKKTTLHHE